MMDFFSTSQQIIDTIQAHGYQYRHQIAKGGFATIHLVNSQKYSQEFAIKVQPKSSVGYNEHELQTLVKLQHSSVTKVYEYFQDEDKNLYIVLEYCTNGSLINFIKNVGPLTNDMLFTFCYWIATALEYCHDQNIVHLDIKPGNILIDGYGRPKLADFGLSHETQGKKSTLFSGSKNFQSPQVISREPYDPFKADVWSLGCTFYFIATGVIPFFDKNEKALIMKIENGIYEIPKTVSPKMAAIIQKMLSDDEKSRPSMKSVVRALDQCLSEKKQDTINNPKFVPVPVNARSKVNLIRSRRKSFMNCASISILGGSSPSSNARGRKVISAQISFNDLPQQYEDEGLHLKNDENCE
ncbi:CAMK family protein kinase [Tritrichomonas foetus]|uniref:CAMK family protein kinase n=1 Tax=Tritrichomonas foetus TaxID=1144522 RepID=A0A1J4JFW5_9EUKA|nr:CAMK family protein kinase [Tritrichomonas foetus]|eukprot:OHS97545.1 CAMK family protein kinase [Tritrichomonas foetus]